MCVEKRRRKGSRQTLLTQRAFMRSSRVEDHMSDMALAWLKKSISSSGVVGERYSERCVRCVVWATREDSASTQSVSNPFTPRTLSRLAPLPAASDAHSFSNSTFSTPSSDSSSRVAPTLLRVGARRLAAEVLRECLAETDDADDEVEAVVEVEVEEVEGRATTEEGLEVEGVSRVALGEAEDKEDVRVRAAELLKLKLEEVMTRAAEIMCGEEVEAEGEGMELMLELMLVLELMLMLVLELVLTLGGELDMKGVVGVASPE